MGRTVNEFMPAAAWCSVLASEPSNKLGKSLKRQAREPASSLMSPENAIYAARLIRNGTD